MNVNSSTSRSAGVGMYHLDNIGVLLVGRLGAVMVDLGAYADIELEL